MATPQTAKAPETEAPAEQSIWSGQHRALTIGLVLSVVGIAFEALAVATTMPATVADLGGIELYGWAFSAFMLANLVGVTIAGGEADHQGPARPFGIGVALFVAGLLVAGFATSMPIVIAGRAVQGLGAGVIGSVAYVAIGRGYPEAAKAQMLAILSSAWVIPGLIGPAVAGLVAGSLGWRWVFLGLAPLMPLAAILALPALRQLDQTSSAPREWSRVRQAVQLAAGFALVQAGLGDLPRLVQLGLVVVGLILGLTGLRRVLPAGSLRAAPGLPAVVATMGLLTMAFFGVDTFLPLALTTVRDQSIAAAGLTLTAATIFWTTGAWIQARLASRISRRKMGIIGLAIIAVGILGSAAVLLPETPLLLAPVAWGIAGLGIGLTFSTTSLAMLELAPEGQEGMASSALQLSNQLGVAVGAGLGGAIVAAFENGGDIASGLGLHFGIMLAVVALAMLAARGMPGRKMAS